VIWLLSNIQVSSGFDSLDRKLICIVYRMCELFGARELRVISDRRYFFLSSGTLHNLCLPSFVRSCSRGLIRDFFFSLVIQLVNFSLVRFDHVAFVFVRAMLFLTLPPSLTMKVKVLFINFDICPPCFYLFLRLPLSQQDTTHIHDTTVT